LFQIRHVLLDLFLNVLLGFQLCLKLEFGCVIVVDQYFLIELMNVMSRQFFKTCILAVMLDQLLGVSHIMHPVNCFDGFILLPSKIIGLHIFLLNATSFILKLCF